MDGNMECGTGRRQSSRKLERKRKRKMDGALLAGGHDEMKLNAPAVKAALRVQGWHWHWQYVPPFSCASSTLSDCSRSGYITFV